MRNYLTIGGKSDRLLGMLRAAYPEAVALHRELRLLHDPEQVAQWLERAAQTREG